VEERCKDVPLLSFRGVDAFSLAVLAVVTPNLARFCTGSEEDETAPPDKADFDLSADGFEDEEDGFEAEEDGFEAGVEEL